MSKLTLVIGNKNYSSWSLRPWLWMKHLDLSFDEKLVRLYVEDMEQNLEPYHSNYKVPVLIDDDLEVWDSLAILEYLSQKFADQCAQFEPEAQAVMRSLCAEMHSSFMALRSEMPMNCRREPAPFSYSDMCRIDIARIEHLWQYAAQYSDGNGPWLFGSFSIADAMYAPVVFRLDRYRVAVSPESRLYMDSMLQHPAMVEWADAGKAEPWVIGEEER